LRRILIDGNGTFIDEAGRQSAGERYWSRARAWVNVDVSPHTLAYEIPLLDPAGRAGFVATVTVTCSVDDALAAARQGVTSVKSFLEPAIVNAVNRSYIENGPARPDPILALNDVRQQAEAAVRQSVEGERIEGSPEWLSARVASVLVRFDEETAKHHAELVGLARAGQVIDADAGNQDKERTHAIRTRAEWRDALVPYLSDPAKRAFEIVLSDPTDRNIAAVVAQVNDADRERRDALVNLLQTMIAKDYVDKGDPMYEAAVDLLNSLRSGAYSAGPPAVEAGSQRRELGDAEVVDEPDVIDAPEVIDEAPEEEPGDRNWNDR
jgi:hypothetical protein